MKSSHDDQFSDELVESILKSKYSLNEITEDILLNEYADCYVTKAWVSYERYKRQFDRNNKTIT